MSDNNSKNIINLLQQGDKLTLEKIYSENREAFINFSKKYNIEITKNNLISCLGPYVFIAGFPDIYRGNSGSIGNQGYILSHPVVT